MNIYFYFQQYDIHPTDIPCQQYELGVEQTMESIRHDVALISKYPEATTEILEMISIHFSLLNEYTDILSAIISTSDSYEPLKTTLESDIHELNKLWTQQLRDEIPFNVEKFYSHVLHPIDEVVKKIISLIQRKEFEQPCILLRECLAKRIETIDNFYEKFSEKYYRFRS